MNSEKSRKIKRTPSQLYRYNYSDKSKEIKVIGPEFIVRSTESPVRLDLTKSQVSMNYK